MWRCGPALAGWCRMSPLRQAIAGYLAVRRSLGYKLDHPERPLAQFIAYLEGQPGLPDRRPAPQRRQAPPGPVVQFAGVAAPLAQITT